MRAAFIAAIMLSGCASRTYVGYRAIQNPHNEQDQAVWVVSTRTHETTWFLPYLSVSDEKEAEIYRCQYYSTGPKCVLASMFSDLPKQYWKAPQAQTQDQAP